MYLAGLLRKKKQKQNGLVGEKVNKRKTKGTTINSNCNSSLENVSSSKPKRKKKKKSNKNDSFNNAGSVDCKNVDNIEYETKNVNNEMTTANTPKEQSAFCNIASSTEKSKKKRRSINRECDDLDLIKTKAASITEELKEIEIWVPNKKYKGKLKGLEEEKIARNEKNKISAANLQCMNSLKQSKQNEIVNFEKSPHIPAAFVKKALKKLSCHSEPRKTLTKVTFFFLHFLNIIGNYTITRTLVENKMSCQNNLPTLMTGKAPTQRPLFILNGIVLPVIR